MEEDIQTNPLQSWADLAVKYECSRYTIRRKLSDRGFHTYKLCKTLKCKTVHHEKRLAFAQIVYTRMLSGTGKTRVRLKVQPLRLDKFTPGFPANSPDLNPLDYHVWAAWQNEVNKVLKERFAGQAKNEMEMKAAVCAAWTQVDQNAVKRSIAGWPKRLLMCIEEKERQLRIRPREARVVDF